MAKDSKFGTFGGVFTPSLLTILGVIMYMRLPWVVGQAGLWSTLGIILVAHVISVCTGLSISSIATDKTVGAGGPYYIVSRSLGLSIGGTLGLALFVGLSFSVSLYIIGFSESFLATLGREVTRDEVRVMGSVTLVLISIVTLISTSFAIKTQYAILALIVVSLAAIFAGAPPAPDGEPHFQPSENAEPMAVLFGIFFPAVTGFTAGVNMSGDLRDPRTAIPRGTMAAILTGMAVYVGLTVFLALRVPPQALLENTQILKEVAIRPEPVVAGIWGATLSSAIGSIMGAPRILQALSVDRIAPRVFAKGHGKTNEPRNALVLAFLIAEAGILIAELNAIARIVSMVFLATYGFLNTSSAIESWASPDFRPAFKIPRLVSVLGAVTSVVVMIQLDLLAMLGASTLLTGLFLYLKRKQLTLEGGDTWEGIWSSLVRSGLYRLSQQSEQRRNWRPNIVAFRTPSEFTNTSGVGILGAELSEFGETLVAGNGILTVFEIAPGKSKGTAKPGHVAPRMGVFSRRLDADDAYEAIALLSRYHGFAGLSPNTVLMQYGALSAEPVRLTALIRQLAELDKNLLLYTAGVRRDDREPRIDIWWRPEAGNLSLCIALARFLTSSERHRDSDVRFLLVSDDASSHEHLRTLVRRRLTDARLEAQVRVLGQAADSGAFSERLARESGDSDLVLLGLPNDLAGAGDDLLGYVERARLPLGEVLFVWASSAFDEDLGLSPPAAISFLPPAPGESESITLPEIKLPEAPALARAVSELADRHQQLVKRFHERAVERVYGEHVRLIRATAAAVERQFEQLEKGFGMANPRQQQKLINRVQSTLLLDCRKLLSDFRETLEAHATAVLGQVEAFLGDERLRHGAGGAELLVVRSARDFKPSSGDSAYLRRFKRRRRFAALFRRADVSYSVPIQGLLQFYSERAATDIVQVGIVQLVNDTHRALVQLGRALSSGGAALSLDMDDDPGQVARAVRERKQKLIERLHELAGVYKERSSRQQWMLLVASREICQAFADDVARLDVRPLVKKQRRPSGVSEALASELDEGMRAWAENQRLLTERAQLGLTIGGFYFRLSSIALKERSAILLQIKNGPLSECSELRQSVEELAARLQQDDLTSDNIRVRLDLRQRFDPKSAVESLLQETSGTVAELPETLSTLSDESIQRLEDGNAEALELVEIPVRRLFQFLVETKFVGGLQQGLKHVPRHEQRLVSVAQDVERLIAFQVSESEASHEDSAQELKQYLTNVVESGLERLEAELAEMQRVTLTIQRLFTDQLRELAEAGNAYELGATSRDLEQHIRLAQGRRAVRGARSVVRGSAQELRSFLVKLLYRMSAGRLWAERQQRKDTSEALAVDRVLAFVEKHSPRGEVVEALPFYYRQLFFGQATVNENFWVGREAQLSRVKQAIQSFRQGVGGAIVVTGERGAGKTALCQRISARLLDRFHVYRVHPPLGGSVDPASLAASMRKATGLHGELAEIFRALPENSALLLDDLELWWERSEGGDRVVEALCEMQERHGQRVLFVLGVSRQAFYFIDRFTGLSDQALAVVECGPMSAEELNTVMLLRHGSTGLSYRLNGTPEQKLGDLSKARLFSKYFEFSCGYVGPALHAWMAHVDKVSDQVLSISAPRVRDWEVFERLRPEWVALLLQLFLHKQLSAARLRRIGDLPLRDLERQLRALLRMRVVHEPRARIYEINPAVSHVLLDRFRQKGLVVP